MQVRLLKSFVSYVFALIVASFVFVVPGAAWEYGSAAHITDAEILKNAEKMEKIIEAGLNKIKIPAATISISRGDKVLYHKAFGKTAMPGYSSEPVDDKTLFPVASISKNVTAVLVGALVDDGKISFEDKVRKYYPEFFMCNEQLSSEFTIKDLISHSSGLKDFSADSLLKAGYDSEKILNSFRYLKQIPGNFRKYYGYQNVIYGIVGIVLERATGEKYEDLVQKYIFDKMGMKNSSAIPLAAEASKFGYFKYLIERFDHDRQRLGFFKACWNVLSKTLSHKSKRVVDIHSTHVHDVVHLDHDNFYHKFPATSGISLSAEDFSKWLAMLANQGTFNGVQIISKESFAKLTADIVTVKDLKDDDVTFVKTRFPHDGIHYGMGFFNSQYSDDGKNSRKIWFHMGGIRGSTAFLAVSPEDDFAVGVSCNLGGVAHTLFCEYMVAQFLDLTFGFLDVDWVQKDIDRKEYYLKKQHDYKSSVSENNPRPMLKLDEYVGDYHSDIYGDVSVSADDGRLVISNGIRQAKLRHLNGNLFVFASMDMSFSFFDDDEYVSFYKGQNGRIDSVYLSCLDENKTVFKKK